MWLIDANSIVPTQLIAAHVLLDLLGEKAVLC